MLTLFVTHRVRFFAPSAVSVLSTADATGTFVQARKFQYRLLGLEAIATRLEPSLEGWRPSLEGWRPFLLVTQKFLLIQSLL